MDYEKKYKEALERARKMLNMILDNELLGFPDQIREIFPQLKESEDERIRRWLCDYFSSIDKAWIHKDITCIDILRWLEKQKEKEKYDRTMPVYDNLDSFESALAKAWKAYNDSGSRTVDSCEDDYVECAHAKGFREGYLFGLEEQKEYISNNFDDVWDEEDCEEIIAEGQKLTPRFKELLKEVCHAWYDRGAKLEKQEEDEGYEAIPVESALEYKLGFKAGKESEKQKDASKAIEAVDRIDKYIDEHLANAHDMKDSNPDKKYYRGWDDALGKMAGILQDVYSDEKQKDQKPAEKQDYSGLNDLERAIHRGFLSAGVENVPITIIKETAKECIAQMKPAEWSEEDEDWSKYLLDELYAGLEDYCGAAEKDMKEAIKWFKTRLKSLRPQSHWKPSEEQITAVKAAYSALKSHDTWNEDEHLPILMSLINDLKKLF